MGKKCNLAKQKDWKKVLKIKVYYSRKRREKYRSKS